MKKLILIVGIIVTMSVAPSFGAESVESAVAEYYAACESGNIDSIIGTVDMEYVESFLADEEAYRLYLESAYGSAGVGSIGISNMIFEYMDDDSAALGAVDVRTEAVLAEDGSAVVLENTFVAYVTNKDGDWKVAFTMEKGLYEDRLQEALASQYLLISEEIAADEELRMISHYDSGGKALVDPSEVNMDEAVTDPGQIIANAGSGSSEEGVQNPSGSSEEDAGNALHEEEKKSGAGKFIGAIALIAAIGGGLMFVKKRK